MYLKNWILSLFFIFNSVSSFALQHALVVGINEYPDYENLEGAVNDAKIIVEALRRIQVNIPNERVLLNAQATRGNVEQAWNNMVKQANAGDTLIFTYAGHGSHVKDIIPFDEQNVGNNGEDETLVLYDKMIRDDELTELFSKANKFKIVFLADSCHSYGFLTRSGNCRSSRSIPQQLIKANQRFFTTKNTYFYTKGDEKEKLPHVTFITAVDNDTLEVCEMTFKGKAHGALSWFFAQALAGKADRNNDKLLDFQELNDYISHSVAEVSQYSQNPKLDRGSIHTIISLQANSQPQTPILNHNIIIKIKVEN
ncbi:MAG: caspase family protein, partial [Thiomargarita sp.]|nr:caspase family protein [Thiomargarita sp.]